MFAHKIISGAICSSLETNDYQAGQEKKQVPGEIKK